MPESPRRAYDVHPIVHELLDNVEGESSFEELQGGWARNIVTGFGRLGGRTVGVIANNPLRLGGCLNSESAEKAARFVRLCDAFGVPLVVMVDVPGLPARCQPGMGGRRAPRREVAARVRRSPVPRVTLVTRKIYGGAYIAMNSRALGATAVFAWPESEVAVMGAKAAVGILHKKALAAAPDDEREALHDRLAVRARSHRRWRRSRHLDRRGRRDDRPGEDAQHPRRGAGGSACTPRAAQEHSAVNSERRRRRRHLRIEVAAPAS